MSLFTQILFLSCIFSISVPSIAGLSTSAEIMQQVQKRGVNSVVAELGESYESEKIVDSIAAGDSEWLQVAFILFPNIHPKFSKQILESLSSALINNPDEVLSLIEKYRTPAFSDICNIPPSIVSSAQQKSFINKMVSSLNKIKNSNSGKNRDSIEMCLWELERNYGDYF
ncbi:hypothetical protein SAMN05421784_10584 [Xenorhabdus koppenhoeferi]|uniref:Uncharacterized protein n=2 Tax=Xenorhabdus koppenhoeferi TaxID=351659 RepID=A0A1I7FUN4_9GAMM|nr:hypothetical protein [Xenorhabdus koppenhoeferi]SFU39883.1 hypothetical protein SAMN05421784_10584 [Xenorhabdus koppenhoeferi]